MRKCCCCISVHVGAAILGAIGFLLAAAELVVLIPYLMDVDTFNPIKHHVEEGFFVFEKVLAQHHFNEDEINQIAENIRQYLWPVLVGETCGAGVYALFCILLMVGSMCQVRGLMLPYLIMQMLCIIVLLLVGVGATVALFFFNVITGIVSGVVVIVLAFIFVYFWMAVQRAFLELGNRDYMYSPAPVKPIYNPTGDRSHGGYYPTSPQQFQMEEAK